ncbi:hypothetical protein [Pseudomonas putida]|uniref:hypothetical protein n=1 Tax=Pseudomonas putida TaxID=303 RepID=UPI003204C121
MAIFKRTTAIDVDLAHKIETAESEYLRSRVESLAEVSGNPYGAHVFSNAGFPCFQVSASPSPVFNRIYGELASDPLPVLKLLKASAEHSAVTPLIGKPSAIEQYAHVGETRLVRLRGGTHLQFACAIEKVVLSCQSFEIEKVTSKTLADFADLHAGAFHPKQELRLLNQASFAGLAPNGRLGSKEAWLPLGRCDRAGQLPKSPKSATCRFNSTPCASTISPGRKLR